ncbi:hypothetical protein ACFV1L_32820 [Kitasatospora sp. NPDC059646]|uniref:hypothetical protein n=1 Tax=Kitasatospora sp. NPDC059646 TaxID=3346893 RepID=UPI0036941120
MRALHRTVAALALTAPVLLGCAGLASAQEGLNADYGHGQFYVGEQGAGVMDTNSVVSPDGPQFSNFWVFAGPDSISGEFIGSGATYSAE